MFLLSTYCPNAGCSIRCGLQNAPFNGQILTDLDSKLDSKTLFSIQIIDFKGRE